MPSDAELLATIKSNYLAELARESEAPKPSYSIDGQSVSWDSYRDSLWAKIKEIDAQIAAAEPFEFTSQGWTL